MRKRKGINYFIVTGWNPVIAVLFSCLLPVLRVQSAEYNSVDSVMSSEEQPVRKTQVKHEPGKVFMVFIRVN